MTYLNLTVLFHESVQSRVYLAMLKKSGYIPRKIIYLQFYRGRKYNIIRKIIGRNIANLLLDLISKDRHNKNLANIFLNQYGLSNKDLKFNIKKYTKEYSEVTIRNINSEKLVLFLQKEQSKTFLFTGGGLLKSEILNIEKARFIHIHPGIVPHIKGSDGLFWSYLLTNKSGYTCFYMNNGIDTGDILYKHEYNIHKYIKGSVSQYSSSELYIHLLKYYDPLLRAETLIKLINRCISNGVSLDQIEFEKQNPDSGRVYFKMHKMLLNFTVEKIRKEMNG